MFIVVMLKEVLNAAKNRVCLL